jgi:hypothetical protein
MLERSNKEKDMRRHVKGFLFGLSMLMGLMWVSEASAIPSGGSRLLFYFSNRSFSATGPATNANTLLFLTNSTSSSPTKVAIKYYRGSNCAETVPVIQDIAAGQTLTFDSSVQAPTFEEGVMEAFFVNGAGSPVRNDFGSGSSIVIDRNMATVVRLPAALLHSDNRTAAVNSPIADNTVGSTFAPVLLNGQFADTSIVTTRLALFAPGTAPGTASSDKTGTVGFRQPNGGGAVEVPLDFQCGRTSTLAQVRGLSPAAFQAAFPAGGLVVPTSDGQDKGLHGWLIEVIQLGGGVDILFGQLLQGFGVLDQAAHP